MSLLVFQDFGWYLNKQQISPDSQFNVGKMVARNSCPDRRGSRWRWHMIKAILLGGLLAVSCAPAMAATMNMGDAVVQWSQSCAPDVKGVCKGLRPGDGAFLACLSQKATPQCQTATSTFLANMDARFAAQKAAPGICKSAINKFCSNFQAGSARILRCLIRPETFKKIDLSCKGAIQDAGWLEHISKPQ